MSKTKGNGIDPLDLVEGISLEDLVHKRTGNLTQPQMAKSIEKATRKDFPDGIPSYGTDALRFTYCALASTGRDVRFDLNRIEGYRNFCNKLWNAARFVLMNCAEADFQAARELSLADRWILSQTRELLEVSERALTTYRFDLYANAIYEFAWHEYCDWYLELTKPLLWNEDADPRALAGTRHTLLAVLEMLLRASHPIIPFITETIWREVAPLLGNSNSTIMLQPFPEAADLQPDPDADAAIEWLKGVIIGIRNIRGEANIKPSKNINVMFQDGGKRDRELAAVTESLLGHLAKVDRIEWIEPGVEPPPHALALVGELRVMVPLAGLIDVVAERGRLGREVDRKAKELQRTESKLGNKSFVAKAPEAVVSKERAKAADIAAALAVLKGQLASLHDLEP
jgi:valyl-tRNA synthetase